MAYKTTGNAITEWDDTEPLIFTMTEASGPDDDRRVKTIKIDLSDLRQGFEDAFLLNLKEHLIERRNKVILATIYTEATYLKLIFQKVIVQKLFDSRVRIIDEAFLLCLGAVKEILTAYELKILKRCFTTNPYALLFSRGLEPGDFPVFVNKKGRHGSQIDRILAKALNQAAIAHILDLCDTAFSANRMDIGKYSFVHLAFAVFCRPDSYRQIQLGDLHFDTGSNRYFISIIPLKTRGHHPAKINYQINEPLGVLLAKQRQNVVSTYGHLVDKEDISKLALFPARRFRVDRSGWVSKYPNTHFGMFETSSGFAGAYPKAIKHYFNDKTFTLGANALRHTVGTLLAQTGASSQTIQAVLKHASEEVCRAYVDIAFHGLIRELSDAMRPAFLDHIPAFERFTSKNHPTPSDKSIRSEDMETGEIEKTGECGKDITCDFAPITCYGCFRFTPCWDADHSINVNIVQREIDDYSLRGKPFEHMVERARTAKNRIILVMNAADRYQDAMREEARS